jgi:sulfur-carrier protein
MAITVVFLGKLADLAGQPEAEFSTAVAGWAELLAWLKGWRSAELAAAVSAANVKLALNGAVLADKTALQAHGGDEIAFLPPVSGG